MPTFLTTSKMPRALASRIEASIRGRHAGGATVAPRLVALFRLVAVLGIVGATASLLSLHHRKSTELERARKAVLDAVLVHRAAVAPEDRAAVSRAGAWLVRLSGEYEGDLVASELRAPGALGALLSRSSVYVRGPVDAFKNPAAIALAAAQSFKDPFLVCLLDPPVDRSEKAVLAKVRLARGGGAVLQQLTANVHRLEAAVVGLPLLAPAWAERVAAAAGLEELERLRQELSKAPLEEAKRAAAAHVLVAALDEPGAPGGLSELDGERPHDVRVGLVDLSAGKMLLRLRKHVDPGWISLERRPRYASGLDGCVLALDVRESAGKTTRE